MRVLILIAAVWALANAAQADEPFYSWNFPQLTPQEEAFAPLGGSWLQEVAPQDTMPAGWLFNTRSTGETTTPRLLDGEFIKPLRNCLPAPNMLAVS